jgi:hypothetical protein
MDFQPLAKARREYVHVGSTPASMRVMFAVGQIVVIGNFASINKDAIMLFSAVLSVSLNF